MRYHALWFGVAMTLASWLPASRAVVVPAAHQRAEVTATLARVISFPQNTRSLRIAVFLRSDNSTSVLNYQAFVQRVADLPGATITALAPRDFARMDLSVFDVIVFPGGSPASQGRSIGEAGREAIRRYVENGGGYLGICAGAFLATSGYPWSLGLLNARTVEPNNWIRGRGEVDVQFSDDGRALLGDYSPAMPMVYVNGPILEPMGRHDLPPYTVAAWYRSEIADNNTPRNVMVNSPAFVHSTYGRGRVFAISPHPEVTPGLENIVPRVLLWLASGQEPVSRPVSGTMVASTR
ncbi:BPL-N domain-containing protein [Geminisphaera colitermitum]|uniref:BPL-N domain-containing protein n=1 Tax=Geminisphaera colitermitum TaxID=1148786 RepID=UPI000158C561|nr:BPL-N domain-containing protein [Geminisphaera colitermitum]